MSRANTSRAIRIHMDDLGPEQAGLPITLFLRILQQHTLREKASVAAVTIRIHYSKMVTMLRADNPDMGDGHAATEAKILRRFRWTQSRIILLFNRQKKPGKNTYCEVFPLEQVTLWALQVALMIAIRSNTPEHLLVPWCPLTRFETTASGLSSLHDISEEACTIVRVTVRATPTAPPSSPSTKVWQRAVRWG